VVSQATPEAAGNIAPEMPVQVLQIALASTFDIVANKAGEIWRLDPAEAGALAMTWKAVLDYYWPSVGPKVLMVAVAQSLLILGPRLLIHASTKQSGAGKSEVGNDSRSGGHGQDNNATLASEGLVKGAGV
jgi:hypothetical protein